MKATVLSGSYPIDSKVQGRSEKADQQPLGEGSHKPTPSRSSTIVPRPQVYIILRAVADLLSPCILPLSANRARLTSGPG